jgi:hypothetical protein
MAVSFISQESLMRRLQWLFAVALVTVSACSSDGNGPQLGKDAALADVGPLAPDVLSTSDVKGPSPDAAVPPADAGAQDRTPDLATFTDAAGGLEAGAAADLPILRDTTAGPETSTVDLRGPADQTIRSDLAPNADSGLVDVPLDERTDLSAPEAGPKLDAPSTTTEVAPPTGRTLGGCEILPSNHIFNTPIAELPVHANSAPFMGTIGNHNIHLDLGTTTDMTSEEYWGIPYNVVAGNSLAWTRVSYSSTDSDMGDPALDETDCVDQSSGAAHTVVSPCLASKAPKPWLPIPTAPLVEGGIDRDPAQPYGDHHMLIIDSDACRLWELYHCYPSDAHGWDIFGSATFDLKSNALRPAGWTSADAAGFPILPLLLLASEASSGEIKHALRFTISSSSIRKEYVWPARHLTSNGTTSASLPPMGQLFRIKASYQIPSSFNTQSRAIVQALKTYGVYLADGGSNMYIQGEPSANWQESTFSEVQSIASSQFEAVDLSPIMNRTGFDPNSATVPSP